MTRLDLRPLDHEPVSFRAPFDVRRPLMRDLAAVRQDYFTALHEPLVSRNAVILTRFAADKC
jgi:hypothetical protein